MTNLVDTYVHPDGAECAASTDVLARKHFRRRIREGRLRAVPAVRRIAWELREGRYVPVGEWPLRIEGKRNYNNRGEEVRQ